MVCYCHHQGDNGMNRRTLKHDREDLIRQARAVIGADSGSKFTYRVTIVLFYLSGKMSLAEMSEVGISRRTVSSWVRKADEEGIESLRARPQTGRPCKLSAEQGKDVRAAVLGDPSAFGYCVWDGNSVSDMLSKAPYGITLGVRQCQRLMHRLGLSLRRPQPYPSKGERNEADREAFKKKFQT